MDEQVNAVGILSSLNTVPTVQETVKKEIRKINYFASQVQQFISERDFTKLQRSGADLDRFIRFAQTCQIFSQKKFS